MPESRDDARSYLNALIGVPPSARPAWERAAASGAAAARGRALAFLGDAAGARAALDGAVAAAPRDHEALAWRGEARLLAGDRAGAEADLAAAVKAAPSWPWARLLRAVCRLSAGDAGAAEAELRRLAGSAEAGDAAAGVYALLEAQRGAPAKGLERVAAAAAPERSAFVLGVRGMLRRETGDLAGARRDLDAALALESSPWLLSQRADTLNRTGFFKEALEDCRAAGALLPGSPLPRAQAADICFDQALYVEAMAWLEEALALAPKDPALLARRARYHQVLSRWPEAEADLAAAQAADPGNAQLRYERLLVALLQGREAAVLRELPRSGLPPAFKSLLRGYASCRLERYAAARKDFLAAARASSGSFAERAAFYALVARVLGEGPGLVPAPEPRLYLCGIGIRHPFQISVEALRALSRCAELYNNLGDPQVTEFLGLFGVPIKAVTRVPGEPAMGRVQRVIAGLPPRRPAGFVTRIHPYIYRRIANDLATACEAKGIPFLGFGAVSLTEVSWGLGEAAAPSAPAVGARVFDIYWLTRHPALFDPRGATVVYCIAAGEVRRELCRLLAKACPPGHLVHLLAGSGDKEREVETVSVAALEGRLLAVDLGAVLCVPAVGGESI